MNSKLAKKLRKAISQKTSREMGELINTLMRDSLRKRLVYAFRIIFRRELGVKIVMTLPTKK